MNILCLGDVVGRAGYDALAKNLAQLIHQHQIDFVIANGENLADGAGLSREVVDILFEAGVDVITGGNHSWDKPQGETLLKKDRRLLRPANYPSTTSGRGSGVYKTRSGVKVAVVSLQGLVFLPVTEHPFRTVDREIKAVQEETPIVLVDFHAEATSEKMAMGWHLDGRVSVLYGTHTHIPTADARILPNGTAYISDIGMTGSYDSVIGMEKQSALGRFLNDERYELVPTDGDNRILSFLVQVDEQSGRARNCRLIETPVSDSPAKGCRDLRGKPVAAAVGERTRNRVHALRERNIVPTLMLLSVGDDPASRVYLRKKEEAAGEIGIAVRSRHWGADANPLEVEETLRGLADDPEVHGVLLQLPLPDGWDPEALQRLLPPDKDVDGLHPLNAGRLAQGLPGFVPCTPMGVVEMLRFYEIPISGRQAVVMGRSAIVGRPLANLLSQKGMDATVTLVHSQTPHPETIASEADILIVAIGQAQKIDATFIKPGATVIDVGMHRIQDADHPKGSRLVGDVNAKSARAVAGALSPVPGGVGPLTVGFLLENTVLAAERLHPDRVPELPKAEAPTRKSH